MAGAGATQFTLVDETLRHTHTTGGGFVNRPYDGFYCPWSADVTALRTYVDEWEAATRVHLDFDAAIPFDVDKRPKDIPDNWKAPVDFYNGTLYVRVEVLEKPNDDTLTGYLCRVTTENRHGRNNVWLGYEKVLFDKVGLYYFETSPREAKPMTDPSFFDWERPLWELQLCVTDPRGHLVHEKWEQHGIGAFAGSPDLALYLPLKLRYTAIAVASDATFVPPPWW